MTGFERPLHVNGEIRAVHGEDVISVTASRDTLTIDLPHLRALLQSVKSVGGKARRVKTIAILDAGLQATRLTVHFRMAERIVARLGADARPGPLSRLVGALVGVVPLEIRPAIIAALFQFRRS